MSSSSGYTNEDLSGVTSTSSGSPDYSGHSPDYSFGSSEAVSVDFTSGNLHNQGETHKLNKEWDEAVKYYTEALNYPYPCPEYKPCATYAGRALAHLKRREYQEAIDDYTAALHNDLAGLYPAQVPIVYNDRGVAYSRIGKWHEAAADWEKAAGMGSVSAKESLEIYTASAANPEAITLYEEGVGYYNGDGVKKDLVKAAQLWQKAAEMGYSDAQSNLGVCYIYGHGVRQDFAKAAEWFRKAAAQGNAGASTNLKTLEKLIESKRK